MKVARDQRVCDPKRLAICSCTEWTGGRGVRRPLLRGAQGTGCCAAASDRTADGCACRARGQDRRTRTARGAQSAQLLDAALGRRTVQASGEPGRAPRRPSAGRASNPATRATTSPRWAIPTRCVTHRPRRCPGCEGDLSEAEIVSVERRQVFEVPRTRAHVTEHQLVKLRCSCGAETKAPAPSEATAPACYGPGVRALAVYLSVYQHVPYDRLAEIFADVLAMPVSVGAIKAMVAEAGSGLGPVPRCRHRIARRRAGGALRRDGRTRRGQPALGPRGLAPRSTPSSCCHKRRGTVAMDDMGVIAKMSGVAVHDGWKPYRAYEVVHALCNAHHLRELAGRDRALRPGLGRRDDRPPARRQRGRGTGRAPRAARASTPPRCTPSGSATASSSPRAGPSTSDRSGLPTGKWYQNTAVNLLNRLDAYRDDVLRFTVDFNVPFDNNQG